jgi:glutamate-1-semialdehyde 2,1-aminomutase
MHAEKLHPVAQDILTRYEQKTAQSKKNIAAARNRLPGGETRRASFYDPYPLCMAKGAGSRIYDIDGNEYIDLQNNYTSLLHGHADPRIAEVTHAQIDKGVVLGSVAKIQHQHAEHLCNRIPAMDMVRYCNCGTEATIFCLRAARAFTGRHIIIKMDGGYHGQHEVAQVNNSPDVEAKGMPRAFADSWVPPGIVKDVKVVPYNDLEATETVLRQHKDQIAGLIMEPMLGPGGLIAPQPGYLEGMRELTQKYGVLLILDEIMVFRLSRGGMQEAAGIEPDMTALGKIIGGGFPVGAFGGRREIMEMFDPNHPQPVFHSGTFSGNNITLAAGLATLEAYDTPDIDRLNSLGDRLRNGFRQAVQQAQVKGHVTGIGSLVNVHWCEKEPRNARDNALAQAQELPGLFNLELINRGVFSTHRGLYCLSTPMDEKDVDKVVEAFTGTLELLKPFVAERIPQLIAG